MKLSVKRLSICPCGFPVLNEAIPLGQKYEALGPRISGFSFTCGGCGKEYKNIIGVLVRREGDDGPGYLPTEIFE